MTPQLSIIIPVYNTAQYLPECLDSCLAQTFTGWECLLIDDGSSDDSVAICEAYIRRDARFRLFRNRHCGAAEARNTGLRAARGEWIGFADSDDRFRPDMFARMIRSQCDSRADVVICSFQAFESPDRPVFYPDFHAATPAGRIFGTDDIGLLFLCDAGPWNKLFLREFLRKNELWFPRGLQYEDIFFWNRLVRLRPSFYYLPEKLYEYRQNRSGSVIASHTVHNLALSFRSTMKTLEVLDRPELMQAFGRRFSLRAFKAAAQVPRSKRKQFVRCCKALFRHVCRGTGKTGSIGLFLWVKSPERLLDLFISLCFPLRFRSLTQILKKCDSFFMQKKEHTS